jgi:dTDP-4-amino-4,6-dideoxygalactose transaminase
LAKLPHLDEENKRRQAIAKIYEDLLSDTPVFKPSIGSATEHVFHQYVIRTEKRDDLKKYLDDKNIQTSIHYPLPIHLQPAYCNILSLPYPLYWTEIIYPDILSLPIYPQMTNDQAYRVGETIRNWFHR